ncbi:hypothetical protein SAMN02745218_01242 [Desulfofundulus australicus DSM 11792]|uniref:Uncharacterized protein n=1 Tax=Desulfofundulus australicus DSM 11792 TaxID=1121425 RepID=A0A1M4Y161_9FIRM|nr:hypothetical protein [Desulfofundulus australicus]SHE99418.1 hypothetical protein SAMN02745218_01242 [Desulfofundulus australicus DSM 11792]
MVAAAIYLPHDYIAMFSQGMDDYKDYLLNRHYFLEELRENEAVRVIHVPFDRERYVKWLQDNPYWKDGAEARSAWALEVAKNPAALEEVRSRNPVLPAPPLDEEFTVLVFYGVIPVVMEMPDEIPAVSGRLPHEDVEQIALEAREFFSGVPEFKWLSSLRCRGMRIFAGERLVAPPNASAFEDYVNDTVREMLNTREIVISVPSTCRVRRLDLEDDLTGERPLLVLLLFPLVLAGAASEIEYCEDLVEESEGKMGLATKQLREVLRERLGHDRVGEPAFVPEYALGMFLEHVMENMDFELEDIDDVMENAGKGKKNRSGLKRIK